MANELRIVNDKKNCTPPGRQFTSFSTRDRCRQRREALEDGGRFSVSEMVRLQARYHSTLLHYGAMTP